MARFISTPNGFVPAEQYSRPVRNRSTAVPIPHVVTDQVDVVSPIDGKQYDSKSEYYKSVTDAGYHIAESKPDLTKRDTPDVGGLREDIKQAVEQLEAKG